MVGCDPSCSRVTCRKYKSWRSPLGEGKYLKNQTPKKRETRHEVKYMRVNLPLWVLANLPKRLPICGRMLLILSVEDKCWIKASTSDAIQVSRQNFSFHREHG